MTPSTFNTRMFKIISGLEIYQSQLLLYSLQLCKTERVSLVVIIIVTGILNWIHFSVN